MSRFRMKVKGAVLDLQVMRLQPSYASRQVNPTCRPCGNHLVMDSISPVWASMYMQPYRTSSGLLRCEVA